MNCSLVLCSRGPRTTQHRWSLPVSSRWEWKHGVCLVPGPLRQVLHLSVAC